MNTLIMRAVAPVITALMALFSVFVLLRGHNEPGGGFIAGLIMVSALALYGIACGASAVRRALSIHPLCIAGLGLLFSLSSGLPSALVHMPYLSAQWWVAQIGEATKIPLSTPFLFDMGVWLVVVGSITAIVLELEGEEEQD
ncbi:MAG: MnhB domain-containing protein [Hyphomicrobiales bacterium]